MYLCNYCLRNNRFPDYKNKPDGLHSFVYRVKRTETESYTQGECQPIFCLEILSWIKLTGDLLKTDSN